jgi:hypothetical protein
MKIRFYCDVPPNFNMTNNTLVASSNPNWSEPEGFVRVAFDVDLPPELSNGGADIAAPDSKAMPVGPELCKKQ